MTGAVQLCDECGSPLRPCKCQRQALKARQQKRRKAKTWKRTPERYGPLFEKVRALPCYLWKLNYYGPGHECCGPGAQDSGFRENGHTAHHLGRFDEEGLLPTCGKGHDLAVGRGGRSTIKAFRAFLDERGVSLKKLALDYVKEASE